ncbi:MAG: hypothetical protein LBS96_09900 [Oscillospiraceae bacterium]|jgi:hypothetical protein|nr:hypothetical protein [Oscillospiraceae bacterium]
MLDGLLNLLTQGGGGESLQNIVELSNALATIAKALESISTFLAPLLAFFGGISGLLGG